VTGEAIGLAAVTGAENVSHQERLAALFDAHHLRLYRLARRMTGSAEEAKDLLQETFLRVASRPGTIPPVLSSEEAWLVRVLVNVARDDWRKRNGRRRLEDRHLGETKPAAPALPEAAVIARRTIWQALQRLTPRRRAVLILYELEGASMPVIARTLGISAVTVRWHLSQGRRDLARIIETGSV
jgi:RNA polymerase sigma-70 factor (ECF subfamily)